MKEMGEKTAIITAAELTIEDRGILTGWLTLDYGGACQGFGGYSLYLPTGFKHHSIQSCAGHWISRILQVADVSRWSLLKGKTIRVRANYAGVDAIGHIVKDDWFYPRRDFQAEDNAG
jgi:hypothetical protein